MEFATFKLTYVTQFTQIAITRLQLQRTKCIREKQCVSLGATGNDLRSAVLSQTEEILLLSGVSEVAFLKKPHKWTEKLRIGR